MVSIILVPIKEWKRLWVAGIIGLITILPIDSTLTSLGAFEYVFSGFRVFGLPWLYWLSYFFGGLLFAYYRPFEKWNRLFYVLGFAFLLWLIEVITVLTGIFQHLQWNLLRSFVLDIFGFVFILWVFEWMGIPSKAEKDNAEENLNTTWGT